MKNILPILIGLLILSCDQTNEPKKDNQQTKPIQLENEKGDEKTEIIGSDLQGKVFEIGSKTHYTDNCSLYFECDCCSGELIFNSDSTFYYIDYCMSDETVRKGNFILENNICVLEYGAECVMKKYNFDRELDTTAVEYFKTDTILKTITVEYLASMCDSKILLVDKINGEYAIEKSLDYYSAIKYLKEEKYIDRINNLED